MSVISPAAATQWQADGRFFEWRGHRIFVRDGGPKDAPPLLLIHGFPTSSLDWLPLWQELTSQYRVLAYDHLGFGFSDKPRLHRYSIHEQTDIATALIAAEFGTDFHVLTHDYGVSVAQELLARTADGSTANRVLSCAFLNGGLLPEQHRARPIQKLLAGPFGGLLVHFVTRARFEKSFSAVFGPETQPTQAELDAFWSVITHKGGNRIQHKLLHYIADRRAHADRWRHMIAAPPCPITLINGVFDPVSGGHLVDAVAALNPAVPATRLALGHYPQTEGPDQVLGAYWAFRASA